MKSNGIDKSRGKVKKVDTVTNVPKQPESINEPVFGIVVNCKFLNIRETPNKNANILAKLVENSKVMIDSVASTNDFYSIFTETGVEGYCVKQFIEVQ